MLKKEGEMNYANVKYPDVANGEGVRVSLFVSGCRLNCYNCFNKEAQDFNYGKPYTNETKEYILDKLSLDYIKGLSILGGDPMEVENQKDIAELIKEAKRLFPKKDIWLWTGRVYPNIEFTPYTIDILDNIDYLIDGPFIESKKDLTLKWRGSSNQRILTKKDL
jgi:anaerobic ribonucleoside-triphosphate reductase activating protein